MGYPPMRNLLIALAVSLLSLPASAQKAPSYQVVAYYASWNLYGERHFLMTDVPG